MATISTAIKFLPCKPNGLVETYPFSLRVELWFIQPRMQPVGGEMGKMPFSNQNLSTRMFYITKRYGVDEIALTPSAIHFKHEADMLIFTLMNMLDLTKEEV